jgi:hypothetical protein
MIERLNGRIGSEWLAITICLQRQLEQHLRGFNACRQRLLEGKTPDQVVSDGSPTSRAGQGSVIRTGRPPVAFGRS